MNCDGLDARAGPQPLHIKKVKRAISPVRKFRSLAIFFSPKRPITMPPLEHLIEITSVAQKHAAAYQGARIGEWRSPETEGARWLKAHGAADNDMLVTMRNGRPAMRGSIGWLASRTVEENDKVSPRWTKWRPFPTKPAKGSGTVCGKAQEAQDSILGGMMPPEAADSLEAA
jgi:hypothetical protein